jgi:hypothetical protein
MIKSCRILILVSTMSSDFVGYRNQFFFYSISIILSLLVWKGISVAVSCIFASVGTICDCLFEIFSPKLFLRIQSRGRKVAHIRTVNV